MNSLGAEGLGVFRKVMFVILKALLPCLSAYSNFVFKASDWPDNGKLF